MEALSGSSEFTEFYERLQVLKEHHRKYPNEPVDSPEMEFIRTSTRKEDADYEGKHRGYMKRYSPLVNLFFFFSVRIGKALFWRGKHWKISRFKYNPYHVQ